MSMLTKRNEMCLITQRQIEPSHDATNTVPMKLLLNQVKASASCVTNDTSDPTIKRKRRRNNCDVQIIPYKLSKLKDQVTSCSKEKSLEEHSNAEDEHDLEIIYEFLTSSISMQNGNSCGSDAESIKSNTHLNRSKHTDCNMLNTNYSTNDQKCFVTTCNVNSDKFVNSRNSESSVLSDMNNNIIDKQNSVRSYKNTFYVPKLTEENLSNNENKENKEDLCINTSNRRNKQSKNRIKDGNASPRKHGEAANNADGKISVKQYPIESNQSDASSSLPLNFVRTDAGMIKMEEELHIIDTDEDAVCNSTNVCYMPMVSLAKFSEKDLVYLSNTEDNILPYSKLFGGFYMNTSIKSKEHMTEEETKVEHERLNMLDYVDSDNASSVSDDDEYRNWFYRLSSSQRLNEDKIKIPKDYVPKEEQPAHALDKSADKLSSNMNERLKAENEMGKGRKRWSTCREGEDNNNDRERLRTTSMRRMEVDSVDSAISSIESSSDSTINYKKFLKNKTSSSFGFRSEKDDSRPTSSRTEPIVTTRKKLPGRKAIVINPLPLPRLSAKVCQPTRRRNNSTNSARKGPEKSLEQYSKEKKELIEKVKVEEYMSAKDQTNHKALNKSADSVSPNSARLFTKEEKKRLVDDRKQKLKKIALEKNQEKNQKKNQKKKRTKPKVKQSLKTPSNLLLKDLISAPKLRDFKKKPDRPVIIVSLLLNSLIEKTSRTEMTDEFLCRITL